MVTVLFFIDHVPEVTEKKHQGPRGIQVPEVGDGFVKNQQKDVGEYAEDDSRDADGVKCVELQHAL